MTTNGADTHQGAFMSDVLIQPKISSFPLSEDRELLRAIFEIKRACAKANCITGKLSDEKASQITMACDELISGKHNEELKTDKSAPFNVIAADADALILSLTTGLERSDLDVSQASNDVMFSAQGIALYRYAKDMLGAARELEVALEEKAVQFSSLVRCGRVGQRDSVPMTFGQVIAGWKSALSRARRHVEMLLPEQLELVLGGTMLGTGFGSSPQYRKAVYETLATETGLPVKPAMSESAVADSAFFETYQGHGKLLSLMGAVKVLAYSAGKMANDLYVFSSGPRTGYREFVLPAIAPGSSIMPGKLNPLMPELVLQVMQQIFANETLLSLTSNDLSLDVDTFNSDNYNAVAESCYILKGAMHQFTELCIKGLTVNADFCAKQAEKSLALSHVVGLLFGKETETAVRTEAIRTGKTIKAVCVAEKILRQEEAETVFSMLTLARAETSASMLETFIKQHSKA